MEILTQQASIEQLLSTSLGGPVRLGHGLLLNERTHVARFQVLDRIRNKLPEIPEEEVQTDVSQAIDAVRKPAPKE